MFQEALADILSRLETARTRGLLRTYALIDGLAVRPGVPRATQDIDFAVATGPAGPRALAAFVGDVMKPVNRTIPYVEWCMSPSA